MADYAKMYRLLFNVQTDTINTLRGLILNLIEAHQKVEDMYIDAPETNVTVLGARPQEGDTSARTDADMGSDGDDT